MRKLALLTTIFVVLSAPTHAQDNAAVQKLADQFAEAFNKNAASGACRKLWCRPQDGLDRPRFYTLLTCGRPKQSASSWFCSHTVQAPAKPNPLRSHSMASKPWIVRRAV